MNAALWMSETDHERALPGRCSGRAGETVLLILCKLDAAGRNRPAGQRDPGDMHLGSSRETAFGGRREAGGGGRVVEANAQRRSLGLGTRIGLEHQLVHAFRQRPRGERMSGRAARDELRFPARR